LKNNQRWKNFCRAVTAELKEHRSTFLIYTGLRLLVTIIFIMQLFNRNYESAFLCVLTLALMILPSVVQVTFRVELPTLLEIIILIFIFAAEILGEIRSFYMQFPYWDTILHTINGFLCAAVGFSLVDIMNRQSRVKFDLSPLFMAVVAFCFSMTIGVLWEFFEFGMDMLFGLDMQKDTIVHTISSTLLDPALKNNCVSITEIHEVVLDGRTLSIDGYLDIGLIDTMCDLIVNFIGALTFSFMGYFYIKYQNHKSLVEGLIPEPWSEEKQAAYQKSKKQ